MNIFNYIYKICNTRLKFECSICLENNYLFIFPTCKTHNFCKKCINEWNYKSKITNCPICRK